MFVGKRYRIQQLRSLIVTPLFDKPCLSYTVHYYKTVYPFNGLFSRTTWVSWHQKGKPFWILMKQEMMSWQCWTICKSSAPCFRQIITLVPHQSVFTGRMPFLPPNQQHQSTEGTCQIINMTRFNILLLMSHFVHCITVMDSQYALLICMMGH